MKLEFKHVYFEKSDDGYACRNKAVHHEICKIVYWKPWASWAINITGHAIIDGDILKQIVEFMEQLKHAK